MTQVHGTATAGFEALRDAFGEGQAHDKGGAQLCVYQHGRKVVDLWTGHDPANNRPYTDSTVALCFSVSKGAATIMAHILAERGLLDYDAPVARYWPEFAAEGKSAITVADVLAHRSGLSSFDPDSWIAIRDLGDWPRCTDALARMPPLWAPRSAFAYHAVTYGFLIGELIRRITGKMPGRFFAEEIAGPLALDLWIGLPAREEPRVAPFFAERQGLSAEQMTGLLGALGVDNKTRHARATLQTLSNMSEGLAFLNSREGHAAEIPAANMIGNAASLARLYAATIGEIGGVRLLQPATVSRASRFEIEGLTAPGDFARIPMVSPHRYGLGFQLPRTAAPMLGDGSFGHDGAGGRIGFAHPETGVAVGYVCNNMLWDGMTGPDDRWTPWTNALREALKMTPA